MSVHPRPLHVNAFRIATACRICLSKELLPVLDLGETPLANAFLEPERVADPEPRFPLALQRCRTCGLVQLTVVVDPTLMFTRYLYASSASDPMVRHFDGYADSVSRRYGGRQDLVVEIGSNDGVLLGAFARRGRRVLGVEPSSGLAASANARGLETWNAFFDEALARRVATERGPAGVVAANNVLAHIDDLPAVMRGIRTLLAADGVLVAEFPYLGDLLERVAFDTIYHEHLSYFAIAPFVRVLNDAGLEIVEAERVPVHGGSLRVVAAPIMTRRPSPRVAGLLDEERALDLGADPTYRTFAHRAGQARDALIRMIATLRSSGHRVAAFGATAKGNTLLNFCGLGERDIEFVADSTPLKHRLLTPGGHIPIRPERALDEERPDYAILLAWNYAEEILKRRADWVAAGGRFIHPVPVARVIP